MDYEMDFSKPFDVDAMIGGDVDYEDDALTLPDDSLFEDDEDY